MKPDKRPLQRVNYPLLWFAKLTGVLPALLYFRPLVRREAGAPRLVLPKGTLLVSNHQSLLDFVLYLLIFPFNTLRFLIAEVLFSKNAVLSGLLYAMGSIFVDRSAFDFSFVRDSVAALRRGNTVGIFPQGRLPVGDTPFPFLPSVIVIALHADAPIVPVYTAGGYGKHRAAVAIGAPIDLAAWRTGTGEPDEEELAALSARLQAHVFSLAALLQNKDAKKG